MQDIRDVIRGLRMARGWTQSELARRVGVDRRIIGSIEAGQYPASARLLRSIELALQLRKGELLVYVVRRDLQKLSAKLSMTFDEIRQLAKEASP